MTTFSRDFRLIGISWRFTWLRSAPARPMNAFVLLAFVALVFVRTGYVYPSRTPVLRRLTLALGSIWAVLVARRHVAAARALPAARAGFAFLSHLLLIALVLPAVARGSPDGARGPRSEIDETLGPPDLHRSLYRARHPERRRRGLDDEVFVLDLQADARRRRHGVLRRGGTRVVQDGRRPAGRAAGRHLPAPPFGGSRHRGSPVPPPSRGRSHRSDARRCAQRPRGGDERGRKHHHAAAGAHAVSLEPAHGRPEDPGGRHRAPAGVSALEVADPRALPQPRVPVGRTLRRRADVPQPVRQAGQGRHVARGRAHRGVDPGAVGAVALVEPRRRDPPQPRRPRADAGRGHDHG